MGSPPLATSHTYDNELSLGLVAGKKSREAARPRLPLEYPSDSPEGPEGGRPVIVALVNITRVREEG